MKFLNFCVRNKAIISILTVIICCSIILIIDKVFHDYYEIQWSISFFGCAVMWFVNFCIIDSEKLEDKNPNKESDNSKEPKQNK